MENKEYIYGVDRGGNLHPIERERAKLAREAWELYIESEVDVVVDFEGSSVRASQIVAFLSDNQAQEHENRKKGLWKCRHGKWHKKFETCHCALGGSKKVGRNIPHNIAKAVEFLTAKYKYKDWCFSSNSITCKSHPYLSFLYDEVGLYSAKFKDEFKNIPREELVRQSQKGVKVVKRVYLLKWGK